MGGARTETKGLKGWEEVGRLRRDCRFSFYLGKVLTMSTDMLNVQLLRLYHSLSSEPTLSCTYAPIKRSALPEKRVCSQVVGVVGM